MQTDETFEPAPVLLTTWLSRPAWTRATFASLSLHLLIMLLLAVTTTAARHGVPWDTTGQVTISLNSQSDATDYYADEGDGSSGAAAAPATFEIQSGGPGSSVASDSPFDDTPPVDVGDRLPSKEFAAASSPKGISSGTDSRGMLNGGGAGNGNGNGISKGTGSGRARTEVFGTQGEGYSFVYVFDHSGSMGGGGHSPLAEAKAELKASLTKLGDLHRFQIIFYNDHTTICPVAGREGRLPFATEPNKTRAFKFIDGIIADGGTRHEEALLEALKYGPEVIFFLTDADQPELSAAQLARISRANKSGATINAIEFGLGPQLNSNNFLVRLAKQNGGQHVYRDVSRTATASR